MLKLHFFITKYFIYYIQINAPTKTTGNIFFPIPGLKGHMTETDEYNVLNLI